MLSLAFGQAARCKGTLSSEPAVPKEYITATWLRWVATINPTTYVFSAMRSLLLDGWRAGPLLVGMAVVAGFATLTGALAVLEARKATQLG